MTTLMIGINEMNIQHDRYLHNLDDSEVRGTKYGYVRLGEKWVPAILVHTHLDVGLGARDQTVVMEYSKDPDGQLVWIYDGTSVRRPHFVNPKQITFQATEDEVEFKEGRANKLDMLRDWKFISPTEHKGSIRVI